MAEIDRDRLLDGLRTLRTFGGRAEGKGVVRPTFSEADMAARAWLRDRMEAAGMAASIDGVGNVIGRSPNPGPALVIGSHSDTQPTGGWLDGALGVMYGIEIAQALLTDPETAHLAVDAVAWTDEEGTYTSCLGSRSFVGDFPDADMAHANAEGETIAEAIERVGLASVAPARCEPDRHIGYLEAHIEQGPHLEDQGLAIGVVTSIVGIRALDVTFVGEQNHAGTTPMPRRKDAGRALFDFGSRINRRLESLASDSTVWTIGVASLHPGAQSIIPGRAALTIQFRDPDEHVLVRFEQEIASLAEEMTAEGPVGVVAERRREPIAPTLMDDGLRSRIAAAAEGRASGSWVEMPSAAGHDPMVISHHLPCAMLFIPSIDGISHDFAEDSHDADIVLGCQVLADAAAAILLGN